MSEGVAMETVPSGPVLLDTLVPVMRPLLRLLAVAKVSVLVDTLVVNNGPGLVGTLACSVSAAAEAKVPVLAGTLV